MEISNEKFTIFAKFRLEFDDFQDQIQNILIRLCNVDQAAFFGTLSLQIYCALNFLSMFL